jgi:hypothetical protein
MMCDCAIWDLDLSPVFDVACCGLYKKEWFLWRSAIKLLNMFSVVPADCKDLL